MGNWIKILLAATIGVVVFFAVTLLTKITSGPELPLQVTGALMEAIVTAFITVILLSGQSNAEEVKERNVEVFRRKIDIIKNFINTLWISWEEQKMTMEVYAQIVATFQKEIVLYLSQKNFDSIA